MLLLLKLLLKFGFVSTRYKDIFDFYYLINNESLSKDKLLKCFDTFIFRDETMKENNLEDIFNRLKIECENLFVCNFLNDNYFYVSKCCKNM